MFLILNKLLILRLINIKDIRFIILFIKYNILLIKIIIIFLIIINNFSLSNFTYIIFFSKCIFINYNILNILTYIFIRLFI